MLREEDLLKIVFDHVSFACKLCMKYALSSSGPLCSPSFHILSLDNLPPNVVNFTDRTCELT